MWMLVGLAGWFDFIGGHSGKICPADEKGRTDVYKDAAI
jgi:hypothetical protein